MYDNLQQIHKESLPTTKNLGGGGEAHNKQKKAEEIALLDTLHFVEETLQNSTLISLHIKLRSSGITVRCCQI